MVLKLPPIKRRIPFTFLVSCGYGLPPQPLEHNPLDHYTGKFFNATTTPPHGQRVKVYEYSARLKRLKVSYFNIYRVRGSKWPPGDKFLTVVLFLRHRTPPQLCPPRNFRSVFLRCNPTNPIHGVLPASYYTDLF